MPRYAMKTLYFLTAAFLLAWDPLQAQETKGSTPAAAQAAPAEETPAPTEPAAASEETPKAATASELAAPAPADAPKAAPADVKPEEAVPPQAVIPEMMPSAEPPAASTAPAAPEPAPAPAPAPSAPAMKDVVTCASYTREIWQMYERHVKEAKEYTEKSHFKILTFMRDEEEIQGKITGTQKDLDAKTAEDSKANKKAIKELGKEVKRLNKDLAKAQKERRRQCAAVADQLSEMKARHIEEMKAKYAEVAGLLSAD